MKRFRTIGLALLALLALGALLASTASAVEGILPLNKKDFLFEGGLTTLETARAGFAVACTTLDDSAGEMESDSHGKAVLQLLGCKTNGLGFNSVGDAKEVILAKMLFLVCLISSSALLFGLAAETDETLVLEVPAVGLKVEIKGLVIGHVLPAGEGKSKHFTVDFEGSKGLQNVKECTDEKGGVKKHSLSVNIDKAGAETASINIGTGLVLFLEEVQFMDK